MTLVLGLDIGGANLKAATSTGDAVSVSFPLWKQPEQLAAAVREFVQRWPTCDTVAVTMTGELADCYASKAEGVARILDAVTTAAEGRTVAVWGVDGRFRSVAESLQNPIVVAASNWQALATWAARDCHIDTGLLIDIGSTTTDIIPIQDGQPVARGRTDLGRLQAGELVYTGVRRTPLCAVAREVPFRGTWCPVAAELFATTLDVYLWLGLIPEDPTDHDTADGRPATHAAAANRLCHMLCCDRSELTAADIDALAVAFLDRQIQQLSKAVRDVANRLPAIPQVVISGSGEFLARSVLENVPVRQTAECISLTARYGNVQATAACAAAVAYLQRDMQSHHTA